MLLEKVSNNTNPELNDLLQQDGVSISRNKFTPAPTFRARNPPDIDARIHLERKPSNDPVDYSKPKPKSKSTSSIPENDPKSKSSKSRDETILRICRLMTSRSTVKQFKM